MRPISIRELRWLLERHDPPCTSIYLPAERQVDPAADRRRFEALVDQAEALLRRGLGAGEAEALLAPLRELSQAPFWSSRRDALAVFRSRDVFTHYRIPATVPQLAVVADTFHTRPLVRYLNSSRRSFFVLALAPGEVKLLEGTPERLAPVDLEDLPPDVRDAISDPVGRAHLTPEAPPELPSRGRARAGARGGNGAAPEALTRFFAAVDAALWAWLEEDLAPLILAGMPQHHATYRAASRYPELLEEGIAETSPPADVAELHRRALELIREHDADVLGAVLARLSSALSSGDGDTDLHAIARAAVDGRVRLLVFAADAQQWGRLDRRTGALELYHRQLDDVDADVIDDLCEVVLLAGGDVHEVPPGALPAPIAAIYR